MHNSHYSDMIYSGGSRISPRLGSEPSSWHKMLPKSPQNCLKLIEFGRPGGGGGVHPSRPPLRSTNDIYLQYCIDIIFTTECY